MCDECHTQADIEERHKARPAASAPERRAPMTSEQAGKLLDQWTRDDPYNSRALIRAVERFHGITEGDA